MTKKDVKGFLKSVFDSWAQYGQQKRAKPIAERIMKDFGEEFQSFDFPLVMQDFIVMAAVKSDLKLQKMLPHESGITESELEWAGVSQKHRVMSPYVDVAEKLSLITGVTFKNDFVKAVKESADKARIKLEPYDWGARKYEIKYA